MPQNGKAPEVPPVSPAVDELAVQDNPHGVDRIEAVRNALRNIIFGAAGFIENLEGLGEEPILPQGQPGDPDLNQDGMFRLYRIAAQPQAPENEDGNLQEPANSGDIEGPDNVNLVQAGPVAMAVDDVEEPGQVILLAAGAIGPADVNTEPVRRAARSWERGAEACRLDTRGAEVVRPDTIGAEAVRPDTMGAEAVRPDTMGAEVARPDTVDVEEPTDSSSPRKSRTPPSKRPRLDLGAGSSKDSK